MSRPAVDLPVPEWLRNLPVAPEYRPTEAEFADPINYILKIEAEASRYGICKIVPPLETPPLDATLRRLRASFSANAAADGDAAGSPTFSTRLQQVGLSPKNRRAAKRGVWESGERYTLEDFQVKARDFDFPRHAAPPRNATALQLEALFWGACAAKPFNVEYGNDMPGSGFATKEEIGAGGSAARDIGETEWNMRLAPRARGSLLRAMARDIAGVTTPMLYVAMLYSWFAWHVEDHELHSLNYLHFGAPKTWYGVPRDAMLAFEDAVRVHGYADDVNAIMAFHTLNEKTTVLSPEVLLSAGVPCCRLVQNYGEFVITFPGAYHSGFSHGFNCGEATNIATPRWLQVAKEAAIRRASTNCGPMVSHYQLLYKSALSLPQRGANTSHDVPRSSRLRDKKKNESEIMIKKTFIGTVIENNSFLSILGKGPCIIVPRVEFSLPSVAPDGTVKEGPVDDPCNRRKKYKTKFGTVSTPFCFPTPDMLSGVRGNSTSHQGVGLFDQGRLPCAQCGILSFSCVAIVQPKEAAAQFVVSREGISSGATDGEILKSDDISNCVEDPPQGQGPASRTNDTIINSIISAQVSDRCEELYSNTHGGTSALGLLASAYESSDSDDEAPGNISTGSENNDAAGFTNIQSLGTSVLQKSDAQLCHEECSVVKPSENKNTLLTQASRETNIRHFSELGEPPTSYEQWSTYLDLDDDVTASGVNASSDTTMSSGKGSTVPDALAMLKLKSNNGSCKMHVFCLEHALEAWTQLQQIGGANIMILCHSEYPRAELEAKAIAEDIGMKHAWKDITFKEATDEEIRVIKMALLDEEMEPPSSDWAVQMGINIYYSAKQSKSPLYSKQVPYNSIIYKAFGQENPDSFTDDEEQRSGTTKKKVAGWWCGKVWMSNQVHPLLALEHEEQNHDMFCSKAMLSSTSHGKIKEPSARSTTHVNRNKSKRLLGLKEGDSVKKSRTKKKRCTVSDEPTLHLVGIGMISEANHDQLRNIDDYDKHDDTNESKEAPNTQQYRQHELQNMNKRSSSKRQKGDKRNNFHELHDENGDIDCRLDMHNKINTTIGNWNNSPSEFDVVKLESNIRSQGTKGKSSKRKTSDDLSNGQKKLQKIDKKASTKKLKDGKTNKQFRENHTEDVDLVRVSNGDEAIQDNWDEFPEQKSDDVKVKSRGKIRTGKEKGIKCLATDGLCSGDKEGKFSGGTGCNIGDEDTIENWNAIPKEKSGDAKVKSSGKIQSGKKKGIKLQASDGLHNGDKGVKYPCDIEGCDMSFSSQQDLALHKKDICPVKGCKKKFFSHKYLLHHRKVHLDERPLMCTWGGCNKTFKWPWARTEHMRVHTGVRPYACTEPGCTQTFRFVSDFSRHKRKTGHSSGKKRKNST